MQYCNRFKRNCARVHIFGNNGADGQLGLGMASIALLRSVLPTGELFPNARILHIADDCLDALFMSESVDHLTWCFGLDGVPEDGSFPVKTEMIRTFMPRLTRLSLHSTEIVDEYCEPMARLCSGLSQLRYIALPRYTLSPQVMRALAGLPFLENIVANDPPDDYGMFGQIGDRRATWRWTESVVITHTNDFNSLRSLAIAPTLKSPQLRTRQRHLGRSMLQP